MSQETVLDAKLRAVTGSEHDLPQPFFNDEDSNGDHVYNNKYRKY